MSSFRTILNESIIGTLNTPKANAANAAAVHISLQRMYDAVYKDNQEVINNMFTLSPSIMKIPYLYLNMASTYLEKYYVLGNVFCTLGYGYLSLGNNILANTLDICGKVVKAGMVITVAGGLYVISRYIWKRFRSCDGQFCGWLRPSDDFFFKNLFRGHSKERTPESANLVESGHIPDVGKVQIESQVMKSMMEMGVFDHLDLEALLMRGQVEKALKRIELLMDNGGNPDFDALLVALCEKQKAFAACKLLDYGLEKGCQINVLNCVKVFDVQNAAGEIINAYSTYCKIVEKGVFTGWISSTREVLIQSLIKKGYTEEAGNLSRVRESKCNQTSTRR